MRPSDALHTHRSAILATVAQFHTANARVFGSVLDAQDNEHSDLDLLVDALPGATLFDLGGLQMTLERLLGVPVDVRTPADLPVKFRAQVLAMAQPL